MSAGRPFASLDTPILLATLALVSVGLVGIASATIDHAGGAGLWRVQLVWVAVSTLAGIVVWIVDYRIWGGVALVLYAAVVALLILVLLVGSEVGGNRSWLVFGSLRLQPSEIAKWVTCLVLAVYLARRVRESLALPQLAVMGLIVGLPMALIAAQPDMGTALIFIPIYLAGLLLGGVRWKVIVGILLAGVMLAPVTWTQLKDYQKERILIALDPGRDPSGYGYQARQSKIAVGSGGLTGKGPFRGTQSRLDFLPAKHTDFIIAVIAEETGFVGAVGVLALFYYVFYRGVTAAREAQDRLGTYICLLVTAWIAGQVAVNVGMVLGRLPTIGVPLPLLSYGGSSLVSVFCGIALIVNVRSRRFVN